MHSLARYDYLWPKYWCPNKEFSLYFVNLGYNLQRNWPLFYEIDLIDPNRPFGKPDLNLKNQPNPRWVDRPGNPNPNNIFSWKTDLFNPFWCISIKFVFLRARIYFDIFWKIYFKNSIIFKKQIWIEPKYIRFLGINSIGA